MYKRISPIKSNFKGKEKTPTKQSLYLCELHKKEREKGRKKNHESTHI